MHTDKSIFQKHAENLEYELYENLHLPLNEISYEFALIPEVFYKTIHEHIVLLKEMKPDNLSSSGPGIQHVLAFDISAVMSKNFKSPHLRAQMT